MVKVSVIVPVFKIPDKFIRECFNSLSAQTLQDCEFIVVSDGAPQKECSICEEFAAKDSRFKYFKRDHAGVSSTRNFGINQASGEYITFVDSDDWIEPTCCEDLFNYAKKNNSDVVLFDYFPEGTPFKKESYSNKSIEQLSSEEIDEIQKQCICITDERFIGAVSTICKFAKRDLFSANAIFFHNDIKCCEDRPVSYKTFEYSQKTSYLNKFLYHYVAVDSSVTHNVHSLPLFKWLPYLTEIKKTSNKHAEFISNYYFSIFLSRLGKDFFCDSNKNAFMKKIRELRTIIKNEDFHWTIQDSTLDKRKDIPFIVRIDCKLIKKKSPIPIWMHGIKWALKKVM